MAIVSTFEYLSRMIVTIKRLGSILAGDEVGDGETWQRVALMQAHEMHHYATMLERIAAGKEGGGVVFPSWDEDRDEADPAMAPQGIGGVPKPGVMPAWAVRADALQRSYSNAKAALAAAAVALREGADTLAMYGNETGKPMTCLAVESRLRTVADLAEATIKGSRSS